MADSHFCEEHQQAFTAKTGKDGAFFWSHQIEGGGWCNELKKNKPKAQAKSDMSKEDWADKDKIERDSIEALVAIKEIGEDWRMGKLEEKSTEVLTYRNWIMSKLGNWLSQGAIEEQPEDVEPKATAEQLRKIYATAKEKGYSNETALAIMIRRYSTGHSKELSKTQASELIGILESGKYLEELAKEPKDIPF